MKVPVKLFARARDLAGATQVDLELPEQTRVGDLKQALAQRFPALIPLLPALLVAVGTEYADDGACLQPGAEVACFPPVSGG